MRINEAFALIVVGVMVSVVIFGLVLLFTIPDRIMCSNDAHMMAVDYKYKIMGGCYIQQDNRYVPRDLIKNVKLAND